MKYYAMNIKETEGKFMTSKDIGLSEDEVLKRLEKYGKNMIKEKDKKSSVGKFLAQFNDFMVIILIIAGIISFIVSLIEGENDFADFIIIIGIVMLNAVLGFMQEEKAEKSLEALKKMSAPKTSVIRNGILKKINSDELVVGDLIVINTGDYVSADARLVESINLKMEESALTGESLPISKITKSIGGSEKAIGDRKNMVYTSSLCVGGKGKAIVVSTGMDTEMGKVAKLIIKEESSKTSLQKKLAETGKILGIGALGICFLIFFIGIFRKIPPFEMFMTSVSLAVAVIPEGLPAIVTIVLAIGVEKMVKQNAIVRKLPAVEALGSATVICSDKTGTLTQNKMKVVSYYSKSKDDMCKYLALCNNVEEGEKNKMIGEPTEVALVEFAKKSGKIRKEEEKKYPRIDEIPFDSKRKMMSSIHKNGDRYKVVCKGAIDIVLNKCKYFYNDGAVENMTNDIKKEILGQNISMTKDALRVLAVCYKDIEKYYSTKGDVENELVFVGIVGMMDPPRKEVYDAIEKCKKAGIRPVMITGDHIETAKAIGKKIGILQDGQRGITGGQLDAMEQDELKDKIYNYSIFARVSPEHKVRIVNAFKENGEIVTMTGDGVNDAPALKGADIGCAMGITGTDVAKGASDIILSDDNFATIVEAVKEGRGIYENIKKSVHFLLSSNIGEIITILMALVIGFETPLVAIQLLWINLVTDSLPAIALGIDPPDKALMTGINRRSKKGLFTKDMWGKILLEGIMIGMLSLLAYGYGLVIFKEKEIGKTMAFATLSISQLVHSFNMKTENSIFTINIFNNIYLVLAFIVGSILQIGVIMIPFFAKIFKVVPLSAMQWGVVGIFCFMPIIIVELEKFFANKKIVIK